MRAEAALIYSGARSRAAQSERAESRAAPRVRVVESCEGLPAGMYEWRVGEMTNPAVLPPLRRLWFILQRSKAGVPSGKLPTSRGGLMTRAEAEDACEDEWDFIYREPVGALYAKGRGTPPENFCRPLWGAHADLNAAERERFAHEETAATELREFLLRWRDELRSASPPGGA